MSGHEDLLGVAAIEPLQVRVPEQQVETRAAIADHANRVRLALLWCVFGHGGPLKRGRLLQRGRMSDPIGMAEQLEAGAHGTFAQPLADRIAHLRPDEIDVDVQLVL